MGLSECTDIILNRTIWSLGHQQLCYCLPSLLSLCPHTVQPSLTILFCDNLYFSDNALLQSIHSWQHFCPLTINPPKLLRTTFVLADNPSAPVNTSVYSLTIHPFMTTFMVSDKPSIPFLQHLHHICIFWQSIHSWQHLFSLRIHLYLFPDYLSIHDTCSLRIIHICSQTTHPFMTPLVLSEFIHICSLTTHSFLRTLPFCDNPSIPDEIFLLFDNPSTPGNNHIIWIWQSIHCR